MTANIADRLFPAPSYRSPRTLDEWHRLPTVSLASLPDRERNLSGRSDIGLVQYVEEITSGGFPGMRHMEPRAPLRLLDGYLERIVDHDLVAAGFAVRRPATLLAWLRLPPLRRDRRGPLGIVRHVSAEDRSVARPVDGEPGCVGGVGQFMPRFRARGLKGWWPPCPTS